MTRLRTRSTARPPHRSGLRAVLVVATLALTLAAPVPSDAAPTIIPPPEECTAPRLTEDEVTDYYVASPYSASVRAEVRPPGLDRVEVTGDRVLIDGAPWTSAGVPVGPDLPGAEPTASQVADVAADLRLAAACANAGDYLAELRLMPDVVRAPYLTLDAGPAYTFKGLTEDRIDAFLAGAVERIPPADWHPAPVVRQLRLVRLGLAVAVVTSQLPDATGGPAAVAVWLLLEEGYWKLGGELTLPLPDPNPEARAREDAALAEERQAIAAELA